jgi:hypothetical protein
MSMSAGKKLFGYSVVLHLLKVVVRAHIDTPDMFQTI